MSTRALYHFQDYNEQYQFTIYVHHDGYPSGALEKIKNALSCAWKLPRFEADEFGCAFIAANKARDGGSIRLVPHDVIDMDMGQEYEYYITAKNGKLWVEFEAHDENGDPDNFKGTLSDMEKYIKDRE